MILIIFVWMIFLSIFSFSPPVSNAFANIIIIVIIIIECKCIVTIVAFACLTLANLTIRFGNVRIYEMPSFQRREKPTIHLLFCVCMAIYLVLILPRR